MNKTHAAVTAIGSLLTLGVSVFATPASAADKPDTEKCYGVAKAGKNDCAANAHTCAGEAKTDASAQDFIELPKGTCERLAGGKVSSK